MDTISELSAAIPANVPPERVWNHGIDDYVAGAEDPYLAISVLHQGPDIVWSPIGVWGKPNWILTRYAAIQDAFMDHRRFSAAQNSDVGELLGVTWKLNPLEIDPPQHLLYRRVLTPWFTESAIGRMDDMVRTVCTMLIAQFEAKGCCEFISEFASLFPAHIFLSQMGLPREMIGQFQEWENAYMHGATPADRIQGAKDIAAYLEACANARRADPATDPKADLISTIVTAEIDGRKLTGDEVMGMCYVLYAGGLDTVMSALGWSMRHLVLDPALQQRLYEKPQDIPLAVEELLRAYGITGTRRTATADFDFHGVHLKQGDMVYLPVFLAGRDDRQYANPHVVDIDRRARHLAFATGAHNCLGIHLARRELRIVLEAFLTRFANLRLQQGGKIETRIGGGVWGIEQLPLTWDRRAGT